jgi:hypothetical protein
MHRLRKAVQCSKIAAQWSAANPGGGLCGSQSNSGKAMATQTTSTPRPGLTGRSTGTSRASRVPPVNSGVRLSFFEGHFMPRFWPLKLQRIERLSMLRLPGLSSLPTSRHATGDFVAFHALSIFQGTALMVSLARNVVACQSSIRLSALRQPAHRNAAPKCHTPLPYWPPVLRQSANQSGSPSLFTPSPGELSVLRRPAR